MFHMAHTMHAIQLNQAPSHHRVLKSFTNAFPHFCGGFESIIQGMLCAHLEGSECVGGSHMLTMFSSKWTDVDMVRCKVGQKYQRIR